MLEKYFECEHLSPDETEELLKCMPTTLIRISQINLKEVIYHAYKYLGSTKKKKLLIVVTMNNNCL